MSEPAKYRYRLSTSVRAMCAPSDWTQLRPWLGNRVQGRSIAVGGHGWIPYRMGDWIVEESNGELEVLTQEHFEERYRLEGDAPDPLEAGAAEILAAQPNAVQLVIQTLCAGTRMEIQDNERLRSELRKHADVLDALLRAEGSDGWFDRLRACGRSLREKADERL